MSSESLGLDLFTGADLWRYGEINYAQFFTGAYLVVQTDVGFIYGAALQPAAGNTSTAAISLAGFPVGGVAISIWLEIMRTGRANIYYDGVGLVPEMADVPIAALTAIALTGAGEGVTLTPSSGTLVVGNLWRATCAALVDQSANGNDFAQPNAAKQPIVTPGLNGKPGLLFDGIDDFFASGLATLFPYAAWVVFRIKRPLSGARTFFGSNVGVGGSIRHPTGTAAEITQHAGGNEQSGGPLTLGAMTRVHAAFFGDDTDALRVGAAAPVTGTFTGYDRYDGALIAAAAGGGSNAPIEFLAGAWLRGGQSIQGADAALNTLAGYGPGAVLGGVGSPLPPPAFNGDWSKVYPGAFQLVQPSIGLTYGGTLAKAAGNTSTSVVTLTGYLQGPTVPIWVVCTTTGLAVGAGAKFDIYYNEGTGVAGMVNVTPAVGVPVTLEAAGYGLSLTWAAGTAVLGSIWKATCSRLVDLSGNGKHFTQPGATLQPIVTRGVNGKAGLLFDGVDDVLLSFLSMLAPGTTPYSIFAIYRRPTTATTFIFVGGAGGTAPAVSFTAAQSVTVNAGGSALVGAGLPTGQWGALDITLSNALTDRIQNGAGPVATSAALGASVGNAAGNNMQLANTVAAANFELLALGYVPAAMFNAAAFRALLNTPEGYGTNAIRGGAVVPVAGDWRTYFPTAYQAVQADRGVTYGLNLKLTAGSSTTVMVVAGAPTSGVTIPVWLQLTTASAANIYYDGDGLVPAMTGVPVALGVPIVLGGLGFGLVITPTGGALVAGSIWKATCAALADQSEFSQSYTQGNSALQPIITKGVNGKAGLLFDGIDDFLTSNVGALFTFPYVILVIARYVSDIAGQTIVGGANLSGSIYQSGGALGAIYEYNGGTANPIAHPGFGQQRFSARFSNSPSDQFIIGDRPAVTGQNAGATAGNQRVIGAGINGATIFQWANTEVLAVLYLPLPVDTTAFDAALNTPEVYGPGGICGGVARTPLQIITSVAVTHWWRADLGVTLQAGKVAQWNDQVGTAHMVQAVAAKQPSYEVANPNFGGRPTVNTDGADDQLFAASIDLRGPQFIASVVQIWGYAATSFVYGTPTGFAGDGNCLQLLSPTAYQSGPSMNANTSAIPPVSTKVARCYDRRANNSGDYLKLGSNAKATGVACTLSTGTGQWGIGGTSTAFSNISYREIIICAGEPTAAELAALEVYFAQQGPVQL
jgi:hypothetical protein